MKIYRGYGTGGEATLESALMSTIECGSYLGDAHLGAVEQAAQTADGAGKMLVQLISVLHRNGMLTDDEVKGFLASEFVVMES